MVAVKLTKDDLTRLIHLAADSDSSARDELYLLVYDDLREAARRVVRRYGNGDLQATAVVNEVVIRFEKYDALATMENRRVFFSVAIRAMHQVLIDHYRQRKKLLDHPDRTREPLDASVAWLEEQVGLDFERLHMALNLLESESPRQHAVIMHRFFGGLSIPETAELLGVSESTVERDWRLAKPKLYRNLKETD